MIQREGRYQGDYTLALDFLDSCEGKHGLVGEGKERKGMCFFQVHCFSQGDDEWRGIRRSSMNA